ncbi:SDR family NAD(P)-dependent oxidoreductase [Leptospira sp. GIMC2001]|uniref:SDR family NAD(P)-dependent oxidoreductase n=1 Tax=Leptospira sp. GIMC2001 TaxID=1513297 RepID=UPI00234B8E2E|nr:SDR family NAD(P)-dependent oxidoreductase [Leptospira sp. GIMC2001]WCL49692.1 SDR family NAD(P)-dependent oxidoreductase [Leptospira sp. GIMC2001]
MDLINKRIVITGAASGIGKATLQELLKTKNTRILAADINAESIEKNERVFPISLDISESKNITKLIEIANEKLGGIDIFFANAGFAYYETIQSNNPDRLEKIYRTNVFSPIQTLIELNLNSPNSFLFIITASAMSHLALPGYAMYSSTKAAIHSFTSAYRYELKKGNRIMVVYPIATRTQFFDSAGNKVPVPFPSQSPQTVAKKIVRGIKWNSNSVYPSYIFSTTQILDRFLFFPLKIYQWIEGIKLNKK